MNNSTRILAIVVTYYPDRELLIQNVGAFIDYVDKVLIWENTTSETKLYRFVQHEKIEYCGDGINSISRALNYAWRYAKDNGYMYLLTMDQDSVWENFESYLKRTIWNPQAPYGLYGPNVSGKIYEEQWVHQDLITSGMLVPLQILDDVGGYYEQFNVDGIDLYLCYSAREKGYEAYMIPQSRMNQHFGRIGVNSFTFCKFSTYNYSATRLYEIYKSQIIILRRFKTNREFKKFFWMNRIIKWPLKIILVETHKIEKIEAIIRGIVDGLFLNRKKI